MDRKVTKNLRSGKNYTKVTIPTCVWEKNNHTPSVDYCGWHPTTKNLEVLERMIRAYSNEGDLVLDIFMGSGSTGVACNRTRRIYLGCEKSREYYRKAKERIANDRDSLESVPNLLTEL